MKAQFGEFDAIVVSRMYVYLIESKWDHRRPSSTLRNEPHQVQKLRHNVFSWYLTHWNEKYYGDWSGFRERYIEDEELKHRLGKKIPATKSTLSENLEFILGKILNYCISFSGQKDIKNILLFFHYKKPPRIKVRDFELVGIDYGGYVDGNFIRLN